MHGAASPLNYRRVIAISRRVGVIVLVGLAYLFWSGMDLPEAKAQATVAVPCDVDQLKAALNQANATRTPDTIVLAPACTYTLTTADNHYNGFNGLPVITTTVTIQGNDSAIVRDSDESFRIFETTVDLTLEDVTLRNGQAAGAGALGKDGGAIMASSGDLTLRNATVIGNQALDGGGVYLDAGTLTVSDSRIEQNKGNRGAGLFSPGALVLRDSFIIGNTAIGDDRYGGGVFARNATISTTRFEGNRARQGGGLYIWGGRLDLQASTLVRNEASYGGGLYFYPSTLTINNLVNNVWVGNRGSIEGTALYVRNEQGAEMNLRHNTIADSARTSVYEGVYLRSVTSSDVFNLLNNIIVNHGTGVFHAGNGVVTTDTNLYFNNFKDEEGVASSSNHIIANPRFVDMPNGDLHLTEDSPAIDQGLDVGVTADRDGMPRPQGKGFDIGAFEYVTETAIGGLVASNDSPTDLGSTTTFTATVDQGTNIRYTWDFGDGQSDTGAVVSHDYAAIGTYTTTVVASNILGSVEASTLVVIRESGSPGPIPGEDSSIFIPVVVR
ncbi:MAG: PKD domain-containing protein [Chloroflexales bacterium]|nr:PKD domain-containing protein [Chloroflexales bacterium]